MLTLVASAARTASGNSGSLKGILRHPEQLLHSRWVLNVTAAATAAGDTLDVYVQTTYDGTNYDDVIHFTQVLGNGGAKTYIAEVSHVVVPESELKAPADAALSAGVLQGIKLGVDVRVKWVVASASAPSFTFSVKADAARR